MFKESELIRKNVKITATIEQKLVNIGNSLRYITKIANQGIFFLFKNLFKHKC